MKFYFRSRYKFDPIKLTRIEKIGIETEEYGFGIEKWGKVLITNGSSCFNLNDIRVESYSDVEKIETLLCKPNGELDFPVQGIRKDYKTFTLDIFVDDVTYAKLLLEVNL